ncbi:MAG: diacylglycerol kinase family lipid kinase [Gemmatimonadota bacterium]|nr:MAG: diacylglycerol kinase family lipid kinase [Gemmatimonadota bacterium]
MGEAVLVAQALLIHNPSAARTRRRTVDSICSVFKSAGWTVEAPGTRHADDAANIADQGVTAGVDVIAVYGGDGTIHSVAGRVGASVPLGLIPGGTGNLLAGNLRLPRSPARAAKVIVSGKPRNIDLGRLTCDGGVNHFTVACGAGFDAELMAGTSGPSKRRLKMGAYIVTAWQLLGRHRTVPYQITVDGEQYELEAASVLVANCGEIIPPYLRLREGISPYDGVLDVVALDANGVWESVQVVWQLLARRAGDDCRIRHIPGRTVRVETEELQPVQLDGESAGTTPFTAEVTPGGISVILPMDG